MKRIRGMGAIAFSFFAVSACGSALATNTKLPASPSVSVASPAAAITPAVTPAATEHATPAPSVPAASGVMVSTGHTGLGTFLVDSRGFTLYLFEADVTKASTCYSACSENWPPLLTRGVPVAASGAMQSLLGTATRRDGSIQVTYDGHPLYYFVSDRQPGDTDGEGINAFGGGWDVVAPNGTRIEGGGS